MIGLTLNEYLYRTNATEMCPYGTQCALRERTNMSLGDVQIMENALKELKVNDEQCQQRITLLSQELITFQNIVKWVH